MCAYSSTKFAVFGFTEALRIELGPHKIGVTAVCPGAINTGITRTTSPAGPTPTRAPSGCGSSTSVAATSSSVSR
jgi:NAD(P)-dependent dehydrogenase (short-subunit alcohol dehydrogenase family)